MTDSLQRPDGSTSVSSSITEALSGVLDRHRSDDSGALADYIPELASEDPTVSASRSPASTATCTARATQLRPFTIQSVSKPFVYALAVGEVGLDDDRSPRRVRAQRRTVQRDQPRTRHRSAANPLINAGAIVTSSLIPGATAADRFERVRRSCPSARGTICTSTRTCSDPSCRPATATEHSPTCQVERRARTVRRGRDRGLLPAVLDPGDHRRSRRHGRDVRERRGQSAQREQVMPERVAHAHAVDHGDLRHVRPQR